MKTIFTLLGLSIVMASCQKSQNILSNNKTSDAATAGIGGVQEGNLADTSSFRNQRHSMKLVTVDLSGFEFFPSYSWSLTFRSLDHPGNNYIFKGDVADGYVHSKSMPQGSYKITLNARTTAELSFIFFIYTKDDNADLTNDLNLELYYNQSSVTQTVQELAGAYGSTAVGR